MGAEVAVLQRLLGKELTASVWRQVECALVYRIWHAGVQKLAAKQGIAIQHLYLRLEYSTMRVLLSKY
jgi:hypothetical protein